MRNVVADAACTEFAGFGGKTEEGRGWGPGGEVSFWRSVARSWVRKPAFFGIFGGCGFWKRLWSYRLVSVVYIIISTY